MKKATHINSVVTMNAETYDKLQKCLGVNFEQETQRQQRNYRKMLKVRKNQAK